MNSRKNPKAAVEKKQGGLVPIKPNVIEYFSKRSMPSSVGRRLQNHQTYSSSRKCVSFIEITSPFPAQTQSYGRYCLACDVLSEPEFNDVKMIPQSDFGVKTRRVRFAKLPSKHAATFKAELSMSHRNHQHQHQLTSSSCNVNVVRARYNTIRGNNTKTMTGATATVLGNPGAMEKISPSCLELLNAAKCDLSNLVDLIRQPASARISSAQINATDHSGRTILSYITSNGNLAALECFLLLPGIDCNKGDNEGNTPLHFAAQAGHAEVVSYMLSRCVGLNVDARNCLGFTPLMKAALQGRTKCAKMLLLAGASPMLKDAGRGLRPAQWARFCGRTACADVIERIALHQYNITNTNNVINNNNNYYPTHGRIGVDEGGGKSEFDADTNEPIEFLSKVQSTSSTGLRTKIRNAFRTPANITVSTRKNLSIVHQLTAAGLCAGTPLLPASARPDTLISSLKTVPRLQVTSPTGNMPVDVNENISIILNERSSTMRCNKKK